MKRRLLVALLLIVSMGVIGIGGWSHRALNQPLRLPAAGYTLDIPAGSSLRAVALQLQSQGILAQTLPLIVYGRITGAAARIRAGEYEVAAGTTPRNLLRQLVEGTVKLHSLTVVEGWNTQDLLGALRRHPAIRQTLPSQDARTLAATLELGTAHAEGWFFPDTYRFARGTADHELLSMAHQRMRLLLDRIWQARGSDLPLKTSYELLILASIVEKETALDRERPRVAGVFTRRLQAGMRLQTDPTVIYGLGDEFNGNLTRKHLLRDTPYNTYTRSGLPPTPVALPGESSLLAAGHPDASDALYFVASGEANGSHVFSATLREHNDAVRRYLQATRSPEK